MTADDSTPLGPDGVRGESDLPLSISHVENAEEIGPYKTAHHFEPGGAGVMTLCRWCGTPHHKKGNDPTKEMCQ